MGLLFLILVLGVVPAFFRVMAGFIQFLAEFLCGFFGVVAGFVGSLASLASGIVRLIATILPRASSKRDDGKGKNSNGSFLDHHAKFPNCMMRSHGGTFRRRRAARDNEGSDVLLVSPISLIPAAA